MRISPFIVINFLCVAISCAAYGRDGGFAKKVTFVDPIYGLTVTGQLPPLDAQFYESAGMRPWCNWDPDGGPVYISLNSQDNGEPVLIGNSKWRVFQINITVDDARIIPSETLKHDCQWGLVDLLPTIAANVSSLTLYLSGPVPYKMEYSPKAMKENGSSLGELKVAISWDVPTIVAGSVVELWP